MSDSEQERKLAIQYLAAVERTNLKVSAERDRAYQFLRDLFPDGCQYDDDCPIFETTNHYTCEPCQIRYFLEDN